MARGRPTALTPGVQRKILEVIRKGNFRDVAAAAAGVSVRSMRAWLARGRAQKSGLYHDFLHAVLQAEKTAEIRVVGYVISAAAKDAKHAEWWLERKHPERWGSNKAELRELRAQLENLLAQLKTLASGNAPTTGETGSESDSSPSPQPAATPGSPAVRRIVDAEVSPSLPDGAALATPP